jgi:hypothetical protein
MKMSDDKRFGTRCLIFLSKNSICFVEISSTRLSHSGVALPQLEVTF